MSSDDDDTGHHHGRKDTIKSLVKLFDRPEDYSEAFEHFTDEEIADIRSLKNKQHYSADDALKIGAAVLKLLSVSD